MTLIEVLVTLVIISVGLLGVAALQLTTVRNNLDAYTRSQAAMLASDMLDRMRANRAQVATYAIAMGANPDGSTVAGLDTQRWRQTLGQQLPNGQGAIAFNNATQVVTITIQWSERAGNVADRTLVFSTSSQI